MFFFSPDSVEFCLFPCLPSYLSPWASWNFHPVPASLVAVSLHVSACGLICPWRCRFRSPLYMFLRTVIKSKIVQYWLRFLHSHHLIHFLFTLHLTWAEKAEHKFWKIISWLSSGSFMLWSCLSDFSCKPLGWRLYFLWLGMCQGCWLLLDPHPGVSICCFAGIRSLCS